MERRQRVTAPKMSPSGPGVNAREGDGRDGRAGGTEGWSGVVWSPEQVSPPGQGAGAQFRWSSPSQ